MDLPSRKIVRLQNFDYSSVNYYFVTICAYGKGHIFGSINQESNIGSIVRKELLEIPNYYQGVEVDHFVIMPNHLHVILVLENENIQHPTISQIVSWYKAGVTRKARKIDPNIKIWQRSFYEHVIRNRKDYENIWNYIENNPIRWEEDRFYLESFLSDVSGGDCRPYRDKQPLITVGISDL